MSSASRLSSAARSWSKPNRTTGRSQALPRRDLFGVDPDTIGNVNVLPNSIVAGSF